MVSIHLQLGDRVIVGDAPQTLRKIIHTEERVELFRISCDPDRPVETFAIHTRGLQTRGEPSVNDLSEAIPRGTPRRTPVSLSRACLDAKITN